MTIKRNEQQKKEWNAYMREYNRKNKERIRENERKNRLNNLERYREYGRKSNERCKERIRKYDKEYQKGNKYKEYQKKYRLKNRNKLNEYHNNLKLNNKEYYLACRLRSSLNKALTRYSNNRNFPTIFSKYNIDINKIIQHLLPIPKNRKDYHIDHIKPLCSFDLTKEEEICKAFSIDNLRWIKAEENLSKGGGKDKLLKIKC